jgi:hypothetical protein
MGGSTYTQKEKVMLMSMEWDKTYSTEIIYIEIGEMCEGLTEREM